MAELPMTDHAFRFMPLAVFITVAAFLGAVAHWVIGRIRFGGTSLK